ncbi:hypothetical protein ST47_g6943 [Ascochyta rabiei]|uniref:Uncharacterized protein n=1 Tax=Didymella rabiei TaxID=5454 RepID=A0A163BRQ8_DIDRA|nr:hypothetical protein ST47_g6943 [Ascochyta rabiei]
MPATDADTGAEYELLPARRSSSTSNLSTRYAAFHRLASPTMSHALRTPPLANTRTQNRSGKATLADGKQVSRIKERVEEKEGIPPAQQRLIYGGKQMYIYTQCAQRSREADTSIRADDKTAADYQLEGGATLHLVLALRGGC